MRRWGACLIGLVAVAWLATPTHARPKGAPLGEMRPQDARRRLRDIRREIAALEAEEERLERSLGASPLTSSSSRRDRSLSSAASSPPRASFQLYTSRRIAFEPGIDAEESPERLYYLPDFLTPAETSHVQRVGEPRLRPSLVFGNGSLSADEHLRRRSSLSATIGDDDFSAVIRAAIDRMHTEAGMPRTHGEVLQVTKYPVGTNYTFHYDSAMQLARLVTVLVFLNDVEEGGETIFPHARLLPRGRAKLKLIEEGRARDLAAVDGDPALVRPLESGPEKRGSRASPEEPRTRKPAPGRSGLALWDEEDEEDEEDEASGGTVGGFGGSDDDADEDEDPEAATDEDGVGYRGSDPRRPPPSHAGASRAELLAAARAAIEKAADPIAAFNAVATLDLSKQRTGPIDWAKKTLASEDLTTFCLNPDILKFKPRRGDALLWFNHDPQLKMDMYTLHGGCTPRSGPKYIMQRWIRSHAADQPNEAFQLMHGTPILAQWDPTLAVYADDSHHHLKGQGS